MQKTIITLIPQYGELNRICKDWIVSHTFSFEKQKFTVDFYSEWNDITAFEQAILELVLHTPPEPCTLLLKSLKKEVREYTRLYEAYSLPHDGDYACMQPIRRQLQGSHQGRDGSGEQAAQTDERSQQPL